MPAEGLPAVRVRCPQWSLESRKPKSDMSLFSRLFRKATPRPPAEPVRAPEAAVAGPPRRDTAELIRAEESSVSQAIAAGDVAALGRWVLEGSSTRVRQMAAQAIADPTQLAELIRAVRPKDKNVYRILAGKRDALLAVERAARQRQADVEEIAAAIGRHAERPVDATYTATLARLETRWNAAAPEAAPELRLEVERQLRCARESVEAHAREGAERIERLHAAARAAEEERLRQEHEARVAAEAAAEQARMLEAEHQAERAQRDAGDAEVRALIGLLRQAQAALEHGGTARATRLRDGIRERLPRAPSLPAWFERQLHDVDARIQELQDWRTFTVVPKRAELVRRMESLVGAEMSPEELARQIRLLREEWRTLHRGAGDEVTPEHERFEQAAERAYEPCREHFARQSEVRKQNQARREAMLERLEAFVAALGDGEQPNWRAIQQAIVEARREWRESAPVDQDVVKPLQARFHALLDALRSRLDAEHAQNAQAKRELIARAAELVALEDTRAAIEQTKSLQRAWKSIGPIPRHQDDALWAEFRGHCDAVFQRSSQERAAYDADLETSRSRAVALCEAVERLPGLSGDEFGSGVKRLGEMRKEFDALDIPRASARDLRQRFARAADRCDEATRRLRAATERRVWDDVFAAYSEVRAYALCVAQDRPAAECEVLRTSAAAAVAALEQAPKAARGVLEQQLATVAAGAPGFDLASNEEALRKLCVRAELAAGFDSPPEDLELRRDQQMRRLVASMGRGERPGPGEFEDLALEWLRVGPVESSVHDRLFARFERARA
jgi:hypothetical protein